MHKHRSVDESGNSFIANHLPLCKSIYSRLSINNNCSSKFECEEKDNFQNKKGSAAKSACK